MDFPDSLRRKVKKDVECLQAAIADFRNESSPEFAKSELCQSIGNAYDAYISNFGQGLYNYYPESHFYGPIEGESLQHNLKALLAKLEAIKAFEYENPSPKGPPASSITISPTFQNTNTNQLIVNISFEEAKSLIENMPGLTALETDEILAKIDEVKVIVESPESKKRKWDKIKPVVKWIADKSVDVGIVLLPLLLKLQQ